MRECKKGENSKDFCEEVRAYSNVKRTDASSMISCKKQKSNLFSDPLTRKSWLENHIPCSKLIERKVKQLFLLRSRCLSLKKSNSKKQNLLFPQKTQQRVSHSTQRYNIICSV